MNRLWEAYRERGLAVLLIAIRESPDLGRQTARERGCVAPILLDETGEVAGRQYGVWGPPTVYLIDRQGRLVARGVGPRDWSSAAARHVIEGVLAAR